MLFGFDRFSGLVRPKTNPLRVIRWDNPSPANANGDIRLVGTDHGGNFA
jgi:hypothetical protein